MDPELIKAARQILTARYNAKKAGVDLTAADLEAFIRAETGGKYGLEHAERIISRVNTAVSSRNIAASAAQGALFGFGDELRGLVHGEADKELTRLRDDMFRREHPYVDGASAVAGGILTGIALPGGAAAHGVRAVGRGAAIGAGAGALAGAGAGEGADDRLRKAAAGFATGGVAGMIAPALASGASRLKDPVHRAYARIDRAIQQSGGVAQIRARLGEIAAAGRANEVLLGDLSPQLRQVTDFAANASDETFVPLESILTTRRTNAPQRMLNDARELLGGEPDVAARAAGGQGVSRRRCRGGVPQGPRQPGRTSRRSARCGGGVP